MPRAESKPWTYEDYCLLPDDGWRHEILAGEHVVTPAPSTRHQTLVVRLVRYLGNFLEANPVGTVFVAPCDVILDSHTIVQPDVLVVLEESSGVVTEPNIQGPPDLVIEILSDSTRKRDWGVKRQLYQSLGVGELWLVDPDADTVAVFETARPQSRIFMAGETLESSVVAGFALELTRLFAP